MSYKKEIFLAEIVGNLPLVRLVKKFTLVSELLDWLPIITVTKREAVRRTPRQIVAVGDPAHSPGHRRINRAAAARKTPRFNTATLRH